MFKTWFLPPLSIEIEINALKWSRNELRLYRNKQHAKRFSKQGEFGEWSRACLFVRRTVLKRTRFDISRWILQFHRTAIRESSSSLVIVGFWSSGHDWSVIHRDKRLWCIHLFFLYAHVLDCWCGGLRVHRIDIIALIAVGFNMREAATSHEIKLKDRTLVAHGENERNASVYKVWRLYGISNLSPYTRETYTYYRYIYSVYNTRTRQRHVTSAPRRRSCLSTWRCHVHTRD